MFFSGFFLACVLGKTSATFRKWIKKLVPFHYLFVLPQKKHTTAFAQLVGNTPLVRIKCLSNDLGIEVYGKAEFLNPGGSIKDRVALAIIQDAEEKNFLSKKGDILFEGTSGSTGVSLTMACKNKGYASHIYLPDDQAIEKVNTLKALGAKVIQTPPSSIIDPNHYCNLSQKEAEKKDMIHKRYFANQFENLVNYKVHYNKTGEEIWNQMNGCINGLVASCGTGGTIAGIGKKLHDYDSSIKIILADPQGSSLYNKIRHKVLYNEKDAEGYRTRRIFDTIVEGVGINRLTKNFCEGSNVISHAYRVSDLEAVHMSRYLIEHDGLFVGSSSALNCCALVKAVADGVLPFHSRVVVILCDSGIRHLSKFYNQNYLASLNLLPNYFVSKEDKLPFIASPSDAQKPSVKAAMATEFPESVYDFIDTVS